MSSASSRHPPYDPVYLHARREAVFILVVFAAFLAWAVGVAYLDGYLAPGETVAEVPTVLGMPRWVFWGIFLPWIFADIATVIFCFFFMADDDLGESARGGGPGPADSRGASGRSRRAAMTEPLALPMPLSAGLLSPLLGQAAGNSAIYTFAIYILGVLVLAWASNRLLQKKAFLSEYFLGSRSLGVWAFALTFAATSSSGGSFIGFPSLVYTHGWIVALWIGSYMVVPIFSMGLLGKRINQVARRTGAITIPDVLRDRFESPTFGAIATLLIVFFMSFNLIAQFKGGSVILQTLLSDVPLFQQTAAGVDRLTHDLPFFGGANAAYLTCLLVFAVVVIVYTAYGGFRAVVWTDVMQGFVMVFGVLLMLPLAIAAVGGLQSATDEVARMTPPQKVNLRLSLSSPAEAPVPIPKNTWLKTPESEGAERVFRTAARAEIPAGEQTAVVREGKITDPEWVSAYEITFADHRERIEPDPLSQTLQIEAVGEPQKYVRGADQTGVYATGPGPDAASDAGFLPLSLAISFFFMWTWSGAGQPSNMVRLMAFRESSTLRRAIFTVAIYYSLIYFPLVVIFICARVLLPGWETESDRIMPEMTRVLTAGIGAPWLAGLLVAAPFAAVMSTMDSFLLMISSALVRDVYQRNIHPQASERLIKILTYGVTVAVGVIAMLAAVQPPQFLQAIIVFTGSGLSTSFLAPVAMALYWPRFNKYGAMAGMLGGFATHISLYTMGYLQFGEVREYSPGGFHPFLVGLAASAVAAIVVTLLTSRPPERLVKKFFYAEG
jgi:sodium/pantothenate symporter